MHLELLLGSNKPKGIDTFLLQERNKSNRGQETFIPGKDSPNCNNEETRSSQLGGLRNLISFSLAVALRQERKLNTMHNKQTTVRSPG